MFWCYTTLLLVITVVFVLHLCCFYVTPMFFLIFMRFATLFLATLLLSCHINVGLISHVCFLNKLSENSIKKPLSLSRSHNKHWKLLHATRNATYIHLFFMIIKISLSKQKLKWTKTRKGKINETWNQFNF